MIEVIGAIGDDPTPNVGRADVTVWFGETGGERFDSVRRECDRLGKPFWWVDSPDGRNPTVIQKPAEFAAFARRDSVRSICCGGADGTGERTGRFLAAVFRLMQKEGQDGAVSAGAGNGRFVDRPVGAHGGRR